MMVTISFRSCPDITHYAGAIQDFVLGGRGGGGAYRDGMGACPSKLARVSGKAQ